ncbi:hypothetical protein BT93_F2864 [Corymbia citriodora subsp. variegata]|nr:hypothetical protein BT93_F2864 [Corymbia citriodora subsp. variegata]
MGNYDSDDILKDFYIPDYILGHGLERVGDFSHVPACPVIVFVNSKSGGQRGGDLIFTYRTLLNKNQVFDLRETAPGEVLQKLYENLEILKQDGDPLASEIQKRLKLIVAGGDGTANWLLGVVSDLKLSEPPPVATVPLGTGNNLPFSFGWGKKNPGIDRQSVMSFLNQVKTAMEMKIDGWLLVMRMRALKEGSCDPIAPSGQTNSLNAFQQVFETDPLYMDGFHTYCGRFWNYFSMGMDAQVSYAFHSDRKLHPEKFKNQLVNQVLFSLNTGLFTNCKLTLFVLHVKSSGMSHFFLFEGPIFILNSFEYTVVFLKSRFDCLKAVEVIVLIS